VTSKIIDNLINGNLASTGKITFDNTKAGYFVEFQGGDIGSYAQTARSGFYNYTEYQLNEDGIISQTAKGPLKLFMGGTINQFFAGIVANNFKIANISAEALAGIETVHPKFIVCLYWYNPKAANKLEQVDLAKYIITSTDKDKLQIGTKYLTTVTNRQVINTKTNTLVTELTKLVGDAIVANRRTGKDRWTESGMMTFNLSAALAEDVTMEAAYTDLQTTVTNFGGIPPTLSELIEKSIAGTSYTVARTVDLDVTPFIYLYPKGVSGATVLPAVAETDSSVAVTTAVKSSVVTDASTSSSTTADTTTTTSTDTTSSTTETVTSDMSTQAPAASTDATATSETPVSTPVTDTSTSGVVVTPSTGTSTTVNETKTD